ncbi:MAG: hypothetical protein ACLFWL_18320 [Candidatus Brocadiia bacterium]
MKKFAEEISYVEDNIQVYCDTMLGAEWVPDTNLPLSVCADLVEFILDQEQNNVDAIISDTMVYSYDADYVREKVIPRFGKAECLENRIIIVQKALDAHCSGDYELSVPVLCAQVEGTLRGGAIDQSPKSELQRILQERLYAVITEPLRMADVPWEEAEKVLYPHGGFVTYPPVSERRYASVKRFVNEQFYGDFRTDSPLNRNRILHGIDNNYASEAISLRAVLLLEFVVDCIEKLSE